MRYPVYEEKTSRGGGRRRNRNRSEGQQDILEVYPHYLKSGVRKKGRPLEEGQRQEEEGGKVFVPIKVVYPRAGVFLKSLRPIEGRGRNKGRRESREGVWLCHEGSS